MRTLDEVIAELEDEKVFADALHYLREYRSDMKLWESDRKGFEDWIDQYKEARDKHQQAVIDMAKNPPLSWEELKAMEGKPVWVEYDNHLSGRKRTKYKDWEVIDMIAEDLILVKGDCSYQKDEFGDVWQAYRKERS